MKPKRDRAAYMRDYRRRKRAARTPAAPVCAWPADPAAALARWSRDVLKVPPGHPLAGQPLTLPGYGVDFIADALTHRESFLYIGRKNAKSAIVAAYLLARLVGPLRTAGYRAGVCSVNREKAGELKAQMEAIAAASGLEGLEFRRSPTPGRVVSATGAVDVLSADKSAGHAAGFTDAVCDELGLFAARDRALVNGMRSSVSARDGRFIALSIQGDAPFTQELLERRDDPAVAVHHYAAPAGCALDDPAAWDAANPGIAAGIKSRSYMADEARRVLATPADQAAFRAFDLNQEQSPDVELIVTPDDVRAIFAAEPPEAEGPVVLGLDYGESRSASAAFAIWPRTGLCRSWMAFGDTPTLAERSEADGAPYELMNARGELRLYPGRVTPVLAFLRDVAADLAGFDVLAAGADQYKRAELLDAVDLLGLPWPMQRAEGARRHAGDVRAFTRLVHGQRIAMAHSVSLVSAIARHKAHRDVAGNPKLDKRQARGRIDVLSAALIAAGLAEPEFDRPEPLPLMVIDA